MAYVVDGQSLRAVDDVSFVLPRGGSLGVVGESGCGKSSLGAACSGDGANASIESGDVTLTGRPILCDGRVVQVDGRVLDEMRWTTASIIFQSAMNALNPVMTVGRQLMEAYRLHRRGSAHNEALVRVQAVFDLIGVPRGRSTPIHTNFPANAPARDDRAQPLARARISDRRRANHRTRCAGAGPNPR